MSGVKELQTVSLATTYEIDDSFDSDKFIKMRLRICHDGVNPNSSYFEVENMENAKDSIINIPILANVIFDENDKPQFGGHDMEIEESKITEGEYKLIYKEIPIGLIPLNCNHTIEKFNDKNYVFADAYIWKSYSNYAEDIIERDKDIKLSMEILIDSFEYNSKDKYYKINDYRYTGITFLNKDYGTGMEDALATTESFSNNNLKEKFIIMMQELKETLDQYNINNNQEGGINILDAKFELIKKYENLTDEDVLDLKSNHEQYSLEDFDTKLKELSDAKNTPPATDFALTSEQLNDEVRKVLRTKKVISEDWWGDKYSENEFYYRDIKDDLVIVIDNAWENYYGIPYVANGDTITIDFENKIPYMYDWRPRTEEEIVNNFAKQEFEEKLKVFSEKAVEKAKIEISTEYELKISDFNSKIEKLSEENKLVEEFEALKSKATEYETSISTLTEQFNTLKSENETLTQSNQTLSEFKANTETAEAEAFAQQQLQLKAEMVENFSKVLTADEVKSVQDKDISIDEMEKEFKLLYADKDLQVKFNKKQKKTETEIPLNSFTCKKKDDWTSCIKK